MVRKALTIRKGRLKYPKWPILPVSIVVSFFMLLYNEDIEISYFKQFYFYLAWIISTFIAVVIITTIYLTTQYLDYYYPWYRNYNKRLKYQLLAGVCLPTLISFTIVSIYFYLNNINVFSTTWLSKYLLQIVALLIITNLFFQYYWAKNWYGSAYKYLKPKRVANIVPIDHTETACLFSHNKYNYSIDVNGKCNILERSLELTEATLPADQFFRVNKSFILNMNYIKALRIDDAKHMYALIPNAAEETVLQLINSSKQPSRHFRAFTISNYMGKSILKVKVTQRLSKVFADVFKEYKMNVK